MHTLKDVYGEIAGLSMVAFAAGDPQLAGTLTQKILHLKNTIAREMQIDLNKPAQDDRDKILAPESKVAFDDLCSWAATQKVPSRH